MRTPFFPQKTLAKMTKLGLSEKMVLDAYHSGQSIKVKGSLGMIRKHPGYEVGLFYSPSRRANEDVIYAVWIKKRR